MQTEKTFVKERYLTQPRVNIRYPIIYGLKDWFVESKINQAIFKELLSILEEQNYTYNETEFLGTFRLKTNQNNILSLVLKIHLYTKSPTTKLTVMKSLTFNTGTGKRYNLEELFKPVYPYKQQINEYIIRTIKKNSIPLLDQFSSINEKQDYYLTPYALVVYFQQYEYTPHAHGFFRISIPYDHITKMVNEHSAIGLLTNTFS